MNYKKMWEELKESVLESLRWAESDERYYYESMYRSMERIEKDEK